MRETRKMSFILHSALLTESSESPPEPVQSRNLSKCLSLNFRYQIFYEGKVINKPF